ncbi:hypothetical protein B1R32_11734 [Abditibacterium utsteinense]|uniref:Uncharacterized protein n=1 Tax=Abditibacterium utsteinense TaxID=1960156 RepID=A0A2S8SQB5_9BACT|nr:hypothetical protein [Abditibacterium utsteinense]PQV62992.1 hypothetical protein B1R32_11734 [Abditibacterium utsteinense]
MPFFGFPFFNGFQLFSLAGLLMLATAAVQIAFAIGVNKDAEMRLISGRSLLFAKPWVWALAVLIGGLPFLLTYWIFHHAFPRLEP